MTPISLLDYRTQRQALRRAEAVPGRYLLFSDEHESILVPLRSTVTRIGRGHGADIRLEDWRVARQHAIMVQRPEGVHVFSERSPEGLSVNGEEVEETDLHDGDVLGLGPIEIVFVEVPAEVPARAA